MKTDFIVLTGMSGSGKSQAANVLEDMGYYCVDNMPVVFISKFAEIYTQTPGKPSNVAFIVDVRGENEFDTLINELENLEENGYKCRTIFIDCAENILINRYKESRRIHPLVTAKGISMKEAFRLEREMLFEVRSRADYIIDTTSLTTQKLREKIRNIVAPGAMGEIVVTCMSFGFKYGIATEADLVFDVRCFPNPYYIESLKKLTGLDPKVRDFVFSYKSTQGFVDKLFDMVDYLMPLYIEEGKAQLTIAIGCTGGRHRSVAICDALYVHLKEKGANVSVDHRDISK